MKLTNSQIAELEAIDETEKALGRPTSLYVGNWHNTPGELARMRLITWRRGGEAFSSRFREVGLTEKGRRLLYEIPQQRRAEILEAEMEKYEDEELV